MVIPELLALRASLAPETYSLVTPAGAKLTYGRWHARSRQIATALHARGVRPGDRVGILFSAKAIDEYVALYVGVQHVGAYAAIGKTHWTPGYASEIFSGIRVAGVVTGGGLTAEPSSKWWQVDIADLSRSDAGLPIACQPDDLAHIIFTSGTTGKCKPVAATHRNLIGEAKMTYAEATAVPEAYLSVMPIGHQSAQTIVIGGLTDRAVCHVLDGFVPAEFCRNIQVHGSENTILMPALAQQLAAFDTSAYDLRTLRRIFITGAATPPATLLRLFEQLPSCAIFNVYGTTESWPTSLISVFDLSRPRSIGRMTDPALVRVVNADGEPVERGTQGEVQLRRGRENVGGCGYLDVDTGKLIVSEGASEGWVETGDIGYVDDDDYIFVVDRSVRIIQAYESHFSALDVEFAMMEHPAVSAAAVFDVHPPDAEQILVAALVVDDEAVSNEELFKHAADHLPEFMRPQQLIRLDKLPLTPVCKVDFRQLSADWARINGLTLDPDWW
jgi:long-chain acyl-CoA synthetase